MASSLRPAALALLLCAAGPARASNWRAVQVEAGPDKACVEVPESIDEFLATRVRLLPICALSLDAAQLARGFVIRCGQERGFILFRHRQACLASLAAVRAQRLLTPAEVAPPGTARPERWLDVMAECARVITEEVVAAGQVQAQVGACECLAGWASAPDRPGLPGEREAWEGAIGRCGEAALGARPPAKAASAMATAMLKALSPDAPSPAAPPPTPGAAAGVIRAGDAYADVMEALRGHPAEKRPEGDVLTATFKAPALLAYPDAGGSCVLTFERARLARCEGCDPARFRCGR